MRKASEVYREAALKMERMATSRFSCCAIDLAAGVATHSAERARYEQMFRPKTDHSAWANEWRETEDWDGETSFIHECRILALCFMAAISEAEGD